MRIWFILLTLFGIGSDCLGQSVLPLTLKSGTVLQAEVRGAAAPGRHPAVLVFGGFQNAARVLDLVNLDRPAVLASFDYPFSPPRKFVFPESLRYASEVKRMSHETIEGISALVSAIEARPDVDRDRIIIVGASLGAPFSVVAAARDPRLKGVVLVHGFGDVVGTAEHQLRRSWVPRWGMPGAWGAWMLSRLAWIYLDFPTPEREAEKLGPSQEVLLISAERDSFIPREASDALWSGIAASASHHERLWMPGDHLLPGSEELIRTILGKATAWLRARSLW